MDAMAGDAVGARLIEHARQLYQELSTELARTIEGLRDGGDVAAVKPNTEMLKAHRKALQTVLDFEMQFAQAKEEEKESHELDLDAARSEVLGRLHRLLTAGGRGAPA